MRTILRKEKVNLDHVHEVWVDADGTSTGTEWCFSSFSEAWGAMDYKLQGEDDTWTFFFKGTS